MQVTLRHLSCARSFIAHKALYRLEHTSTGVTIGQVEVFEDQNAEQVLQASPRHIGPTRHNGTVRGYCVNCQRVTADSYMYFINAIYLMIENTIIDTGHFEEERQSFKRK